MIAGEDRPAVKVDLEKQSVIELNAEASDADQARLPVLTNRFGTTQDGKVSYRYFEVIAAKGKRMVDLRIYNPQPVCQGRVAFAADILQSDRRPVLSPNPGEPTAAGNAICIGDL
jgi:hypothetical protein